MGDSRIRVKFGKHELEVEGSEELVTSQFERFRQLVEPKDAQKAAEAKAVVPQPPPFHLMCNQKRRVLYLKVAAKLDDAVLLLLLAQKTFRKNVSVNGNEIMSGLRMSGIHVKRSYQAVSTHQKLGNIQVDGVGRRRRYQLTEKGEALAQEVVKHLAPLVRPKTES